MFSTLTTLLHITPRPVTHRRLHFRLGTAVNHVLLLRLADLYPSASALARTRLHAVVAHAVEELLHLVPGQRGGLDRIHPLLSAKATMSGVIALSGRSTLFTAMMM